VHGSLLWGLHPTGCQVALLGGLCWRTPVLVSPCVFVYVRMWIDQGGENLPRGDQACVVVANHQSLLDPYIVANLNFNFRCAIKQELVYYPRTSCKCLPHLPSPIPQDMLLSSVLLACPMVECVDGGA
jgi:hypothetical protein